MESSFPGATRSRHGRASTASLKIFVSEVPPKPSSYLPNIYDLDTTAEALPPAPHSMPGGGGGGPPIGGGPGGSPFLHNIRPLFATRWSSQLDSTYPYKGTCWCRRAPAIACILCGACASCLLLFYHWDVLCDV